MHDAEQAVEGQLPRSNGRALVAGGAAVDLSVARIGSRLVALVAVAARAGTEYDGRDLHDAREGILGWVGESGAGDEVEDVEKAILLKPPGGVEDTELAYGSWQVEGAVVLAWALGLVNDLPAHDEPVDSELLHAGLGFPDADRTRAVLESEIRRDQALVDDEGERYYSTYWRLRDFAATGEALDLESFARSGATGRLRFDRVPLLDGDLVVAGQPIYEADPEQIDCALSVTAERLRALTWLQRGGRYSAVELDT